MCFGNNTGSMAWESGYTPPCKPLGVIIMYPHSVFALSHFQNLLYFPCALYITYIYTAYTTMLYTVLHDHAVCPRAEPH